MGSWVHTESVSFSEYVAASLARAQDAQPWALTPRDESLFRGTQLVRALVLAQLAGRIIVVPRSEANPIASVTVQVSGDVPSDPARAAALRVLASTTAILSQGKVDSSDLQTSSNAGDVGIWPIVVGVCVVDLAALGFMGYCVHEYAKTVDNQKQREADFAKLKEADGHALNLTKQHADREAQAGKALPLDDATRSALAAVAKVQEIIANKQSVDPPSADGGFFSGFSPLQLAIGAGVALGAILYLKK